MDSNPRRASRSLGPPYIGSSKWKINAGRAFADWLSRLIIGVAQISICYEIL